MNDRLEDLKNMAENCLTKLAATTVLPDPTPVILTVNNKNYTVKYAENAFVYIIKEAQKGILRYVVIKKHDLKISAITFDQPIVLYTDTLNGLWNEYELCPQSSALTMATTYFQNLITEINEL